MDYAEISVPANARDFGNLAQARYGVCAVSNGSRGVWGSGVSTGYDADMDYITFATPTNAVDFGGDRTTPASYASGCSDGSRGVFGGGEAPSPDDTLDYINIDALGVNATDFGNLQAGGSAQEAVSDASRGLWVGGASPTRTTISYITINTPGHARDFGDLQVATYSKCGVSG